MAPRKATLSAVGAKSRPRIKNATTSKNVRTTPGVRVDGKVTADRVVKAAISELDTYGPIQFSLDRVIAESKSSRSSVYHLFGSRAGVIAHAEAHAVSLDVTDGAFLLRNLAEKVESSDQLVQMIRFWLKDAMSPTRVRQRARRIANITAAEVDPDLRLVLHDHLIKVSEVWVETYQILSRRNLVKVPDVDLYALAIAVQGVYLGGILVDIYDDQTIAENWTNVVTAMLAAFFGIEAI